MGSNNVTVRPKGESTGPFKQFSLELMPSHEIVELVDNSSMDIPDKDKIEGFLRQRREALIQKYADLEGNEHFLAYQRECLTFLVSGEGLDYRIFVCKVLGNVMWELYKDFVHGLKIHELVVKYADLLRDNYYQPAEMCCNTLDLCLMVVLDAAGDIMASKMAMSRCNYWPKRLETPWQRKKQRELTTPVKHFLRYHQYGSSSKDDKKKGNAIAGQERMDGWMARDAALAQTDDSGTMPSSEAVNEAFEALSGAEPSLPTPRPTDTPSTAGVVTAVPKDKGVDMSDQGTSTQAGEFGEIPSSLVEPPVEPGAPAAVEKPTTSAPYLAPTLSLTAMREQANLIPRKLRKAFYCAALACTSNGSWAVIKSKASQVSEQQYEEMRECNPPILRSLREGMQGFEKNEFRSLVLALKKDQGLYKDWFGDDPPTIEPPKSIKKGRFVMPQLLPEDFVLLVRNTSPKHREVLEVIAKFTDLKKWYVKRRDLLQIPQDTIAGMQSCPTPVLGIAGNGMLQVDEVYRPLVQAIRTNLRQYKTWCEGVAEDEEANRLLSLEAEQLAEATRTVDDAFGDEQPQGLVAPAEAPTSSSGEHVCSCEIFTQVFGQFIFNGEESDLTGRELLEMILSGEVDPQELPCKITCTDPKGRVNTVISATIRLSPQAPSA